VISLVAPDRRLGRASGRRIRPVDIQEVTVFAARRWTMSRWSRRPPGNSR